MLQTISGLFQSFRLPIMIVASITGGACCGVSHYLTFQNHYKPGSVKHYRALTFILDLAVVLLFGFVMIVSDAPVYFYEFLRRFF